MIAVLAGGVVLLFFLVYYFSFLSPVREKTLCKIQYQRAVKSKATNQHVYSNVLEYRYEKPT